MTLGLSLLDSCSLNLRSPVFECLKEKLLIDIFLKDRNFGSMEMSLKDIDF